MENPLFLLQNKIWNENIGYANGFFFVCDNVQFDPVRYGAADLLCWFVGETLFYSFRIGHCSFINGILLEKISSLQVINNVIFFFILFKVI